MLHPPPESHSTTTAATTTGTTTTTTTIAATTVIVSHSNNSIRPSSSCREQIGGEWKVRTTAVGTRIRNINRNRNNSNNRSTCVQSRSEWIPRTTATALSNSLNNRSYLNNGRKNKEWLKKINRTTNTTNIKTTFPDDINDEPTSKEWVVSDTLAAEDTQSSKEVTPRITTTNLSGVGGLFLVILLGVLIQPTCSDSLMMCPVPLPCHCIGDETIYCAFKRMKELPYFLDFNGVWNTMNLSDNLLPGLPGNKFVGGRIRQLDLSRNIISTVHKEAFVGLSDLETLELSYNYLSALSGESLSPLVDLRTLKLRYNRFTWVASSTFAGITQLQHLDLSGNDLTSVPTGALRPLTHLKVLKLRNNKIKQIHGYAFEGLPLETLDLGDNESPVSLDSRAFCGQEPKVSHEERNVMEWDGMYTLSLDHNGLSFIDPCIAKLVWTLTTFDVSGNPLRCDCRLYMFRNWGTRTTFPRAQCDSPVRFAGEMVDKLDQSRFNCSHREQYARCDNLCVPTTPTPGSGARGAMVQTGAGRGDHSHIITVLLLSLTAWTLCHHLMHRITLLNSLSSGGSDPVLS